MQAQCTGSCCAMQSRHRARIDACMQERACFTYACTYRTPVLIWAVWYFRVSLHLEQPTERHARISGCGPPCWQWNTNTCRHRQGYLQVKGADWGRISNKLKLRRRLLRDDGFNQESGFGLEDGQLTRIKAKQTISYTVIIHWASKETYHFLRAMLTKIYPIKSNHIWKFWTQMSFNTP